jgi:CRISPR-associated exonuclease Cas4
MDYIPIILVKEYAYCPRQAYLKALTMWEPPTESMRYAKDKANTEKLQEILRSSGFDGELITEVPVKSRKLGIVGRVDAVLIKRGHAFIVESKISTVSRRGLFTRYNHVLIQAAAYALAVEETMKVTVDGVIIVNPEQGKAIIIKVTPNLRTQVVKLIMELRRHLEEQRMPSKTTNKAKCKACYYSKNCPD